MIKHIVKLIWNQRKRNMFIIAELFLVFIVVAYISVNIIDKLLIYYENPGWQVHNIVETKIEYSQKSKNNFIEKIDLVKEKLLNVKNVETVSYSQCATPYNWSCVMSPIQYKNKSSKNSMNRYVDENFAKALNIELVEGRWFTKNDRDKIIIDTYIKERFFGTNSAIGKIVTSNKGKNKYEIIGVTQPFKRFKFEKASSSIFFNLKDIILSDNDIIDLDVCYMIKSNTDYQASYKDIESNIYSVLDAKKWSILSINSIDNAIKKNDKTENNQLVTKLIIAIFVLFNVLLGLTGILGYNIKFRKSEIGLRKAVGGTIRSIKYQLIIEMLILTLLSIIPAIIVFSQIVLFDIIRMEKHTFYLILLALTFFIILLVVIFVYIPSNNASKLEPAISLKDE